MLNSSLVEILRSLSKVEINQLMRFLKSPYFNSRTDVIRLLEILSFRIEADGDLTKKAVGEELLGSGKYDEKSVRYTMSFLMKKVEAFLLQKEFELDADGRAGYLLKAFRKRGQEKTFVKALQQARSKLDRSLIRNSEYHFSSHRFHLEHYELEHRLKRGASNLQQLTDSLTHYYIASLLKQACLQLSHQTVEKANYTPGLLPSVLDHVQENSLYEIPAIGIYYYSYRAATEALDRSVFSDLKSCILKNSHHFNSDELLDIYLLAINYCIKRLNLGDQVFLQEVFEIYKGGIDHEVFIQNGILSRWTYNNIVIAGLGLGEWEWAKSFLEDFREMLDPRFRENTYKFNLAIYHYRTQNYAASMELLQSVSIDGLLHNLELRRMLMKMYYELDEYDALESLLDSFKTFIYRHRDIGYHKANYLNLISFMKKLLNLDPGNLQKKKILRVQIESENAVAEKEWLLEQLEKV